MTFRALRSTSRLFAGGALACLVACAGDPEYRGETAEVYFARFEQAMLSAEIVHIEHSLIASDEAGSARAVWDGNFRAIDKPFEVRIDGQGTFQANPVHLKIVARGESVSMDGGPKPSTQRLPNDSTERWIRGFTRLGLAHDLWRVARGLPLLQLEAGGGEDIEISGLRFEGRERLAGALARVLAYRVSVGTLLDAEVRLWIDESTGHPLQRRATVVAGTQRLRTTESYRIRELAVIPVGFADREN